MKKWVGLLCAVMLSVSAYAAAAKNTMKMVTYFPVPYVGYDTVWSYRTDEKGSLDIGVLDKCEMTAYKGTSTQLNGNAINITSVGGSGVGALDSRKGLVNVTKGRLNLNSSVYAARIQSEKVEVGDSTEGGGSSLLQVGVPANGGTPTTTVLYINQLPTRNGSLKIEGGTQKTYDLEVGGFQMFGWTFPPCSGTVRWKALEIGGGVGTNKTYTDLFLVCE